MASYVILFFPESFYKIITYLLPNIRSDYQFEKKIIKFANKLDGINKIEDIYNNLISTGSTKILNNPSKNIKTILDLVEVDENLKEELQEDVYFM